MTTYRTRLLALIDPQNVLRVLFYCSCVIIIVGILSQIARFHFDINDKYMRVFDLNRELNIPTWYSTILLFIASQLLALIGWLSTRQIKYWYGMAMVFLYISMDEAAGLHELSGSYIRSQVDLGGIFHFSWVLLAIPIMIILGLIFGRFILSLEKGIKHMMILSAVVFISGALGVEMVGGWYADQYGQGTPTFTALSIVEESLEIFGTVIFITTLSRVLHTRLVEIHTDGTYT